MEVADYKGMLLFGIRKGCCLLRHFLADGVTGVTDSSNSTDMSPFFTGLPLQSVEVAVDKPGALRADLISQGVVITHRLTTCSVAALRMSVQHWWAPCFYMAIGGRMLAFPLAATGELADCDSINDNEIIWWRYVLGCWQSDSHSRIMSSRTRGSDRVNTSF
ncbi:hypothetical protein [Aeromonas jandaei]|uniref:hypothetical protein n=2 Tax=Aeromonadaceae TaxID=84642 RepID=UPI00398745D7